MIPCFLPEGPWRFKNSGLSPQENKCVANGAGQSAGQDYLHESHLRLSKSSMIDLSISLIASYLSK
jgi:hypothetical protein